MILKLKEGKHDEKRQNERAPLRTLFDSKNEEAGLNAWGHITK
jgi:hypothetical protein